MAHPEHVTVTTQLVTQPISTRYTLFPCAITTTSPLGSPSPTPVRYTNQHLNYCVQLKLLESRKANPTNLYIPQTKPLCTSAFRLLLTPMSPTPDTPVPDSSSNTILVEVLCQLAMVTTKLAAASSLAPSRPRPAFRTPEMKRPENFDGSSPARIRNFLQQCKFIFRNNLDAFSSDLKKTLYASAFLTGKAFEWVQPYLEVVDDPPSDYMMDSWLMFKSQLVTLYGDPNELHATGYKLDSLTMKDNLLAQNPEVFDTLSELIEATLKINTRHHERQKEKKRENTSQPSQHKKDTGKPATHPSTSASKFALKPAAKTPSEITKVLEGGRLVADEKERRAKAGLCAYCGGKHKLDDCAKKASKNSGKT
ncbi:hypothetical protein Pst134EB_029550 [Puccinia striiformis f. sp. tritici]|nr:hypothetical protein Pst134EB_029550 [Puccinia striiformis f. sp. tritici]